MSKGPEARALQGTGYCHTAARGQQPRQKVARLLAWLLSGEDGAREGQVLSHLTLEGLSSITAPSASGFSFTNK